VTSGLSVTGRVRLVIVGLALLAVPLMFAALLNVFNAMSDLIGNDPFCWPGGAQLVPCSNRSAKLYLLQAVLFVAPLIVAAWFGAAWALQPLRAWTREVQLMGPQNLGLRLHPVGAQDGANSLARAVDDLMDRVAVGYQAQARFAANASHELRTPLAVQRTLIEVAMEDPELAPHLATLARQLLTTNERSIDLIEGLVALADADRGLLGTIPVPFHELVARVVDEHAARARDAGVTVELHAQPTTVVGDPLLLDRLTSNLIENAIKYNHPGGKVIIQVGGGQALAVSNTGPHVPLGEVPRLFEPFRRLSGDRLGHAGSGLGLAIVRSIATAHHGTVTAEAGAAGGLHLTVALPTLD
jgi:signal transduction histidine kinase